MTTMAFMRPASTTPTYGASTSPRRLPTPPPSPTAPTTYPPVTYFPNLVQRLVDINPRTNPAAISRYPQAPPRDLLYRAQARQDRPSSVRPPPQALPSPPRTPAPPSTHPPSSAFRPVTPIDSAPRPVHRNPPPFHATPPTATPPPATPPPTRRLNYDRQDDPVPVSPNGNDHVQHYDFPSDLHEPEPGRHHEHDHDHPGLRTQHEYPIQRYNPPPAGAPHDHYRQDPRTRLEYDLTTTILRTSVSSALQRWSPRPFAGDPNDLRRFATDMTAALLPVRDMQVVFQALRAVTTGSAQRVIDRTFPDARDLQAYIAALYVQFMTHIQTHRLEVQLQSIKLTDEDIDAYITKFEGLLDDLRAASSPPSATVALRSFALGLPLDIADQVLAQPNSSIFDAFETARRYFLGRALRVYNRHQPQPPPLHQHAQRDQRPPRADTAPAPTIKHNPTDTASTSTTSTTAPPPDQHAPRQSSRFSGPHLGKLTDAERAAYRVSGACYKCRILHDGGYVNCPLRARRDDSAGPAPYTATTNSTTSPPDPRSSG